MRAFKWNLELQKWMKNHGFLSSIYIGMGTLSNNYLQLERVGVGWVGLSWVWTQLTTKENQGSHLNTTLFVLEHVGLGATKLVLLSWLLG